MIFIPLSPEDDKKIGEMSAMATAIVREHFDPIIGTAQNDYMIAKFQTVDAIKEQLDHGYRYYFAVREDKTVGFLAFYPKGDIVYLSKFYLYKEERGQGLSREMLAFVCEQAEALDLHAIELNVNRNNSAIYAYEKLGFKIARTECNDIGEGYFMDDYVYRLDL